MNKIISEFQTIPSINTAVLFKYVEFLESHKTDDSCYEIHHALPRCLFPEYENLRLNPFNAYKLLPSDHVIAHYLLSKICDDERLKYAFNSMLNLVVKYRDPSTDIKTFMTTDEYNEFRSNFKDVVRESRFCKQHKGSKWMIKGSKCKHVLKEDIQEHINNGWTFGRTHFKNKIWIHNGEVSFRINENEFEYYFKLGWIKGRKSGDVLRDKVGITKNNIDKQVSRQELEKYLNDGWVLGSSSKSTKDMKRIKKNGVNKTVKTSELQKYLNDGWELGSVQYHPELNIKHVYINKDGANKRIKIEELESYIENGWSRGQTSSKSRYVNNGIINKRVDPNRYDDYLANGWKPGMKKR